MENIYIGDFMYSLNVKNDNIYFRDIGIDNLPVVLEWYNKIDSFRFATGIDKPMSLKALTQKYTESAICSREFFAGIYTLQHGSMIGITRGRLHNRNKDTIWINSIIIDPHFQNMGYGGMALDLLLNHFKEKMNVKNVYIAVVEENIQGIKFWSKHDFKELRRIKNHLVLDNKYWNVIIMYKCLTCNKFL